MIESQELTRAISNIILRSEKQADADKLVKSFVDAGIITQLDNNNSQIIFGRRGTGKTHILKFLQRKWENSGFLTAYIDMRTLSSTATCMANNNNEHHGVVGIFKDLLSEIHAALLNYITDPKNKFDNNVFAKLEIFSEAITDITKIPIKQKTSRSALVGSSVDSAAGIKIKALKPEIGITESEKLTAQESHIEDTEFIVTESLPFQLIYKTLSELLFFIKVKKFYLLIDEWATVPIGIQPGLAECLKRTIFTINIITTKIATIEYRSEFCKKTKSSINVGLEVGSDLPASLTLDDYYVYDANPDKIQSFFAELIFRHLETELPEGFLAKQGIVNPEDLPSKMFSERKTFVELVRASEGVARDCINILTTAYFDALQRNSSKIDLRGVSEGALKWFEKDKSSSLSIKHMEALKIIIKNVIGKKKARTFLVTRDESRHPILQELFDLRILHLVTRGYSDKSNPGVRYDVFTLDYGTYVDLIKTKSSPELEMQKIDEANSSEDRIVPFDDKRSIRRIILDTKIFND